MARQIPLGRIAGIRIRMDLTVLVIAVLATVTLATDRLPFESPGHADGAYWLAGAAGALLFFVSLLVHELGHALVARDEGIGVRGISLWLLGGVARLETSPETPGAEFRIAVVGPLASAACGVVFLVTAYLLPDHGLADLAGSLFAWLGVLNLLLAGFNILPAAPLDGGTVLSAAVWWRTGSQAKGLRWAAVSGIGTGAVIAYLGLRALQTSSGDLGLWLLIVGGFITLNAFRAYQAAPLFELLRGTTVADAMYPDPPLAADWGTVGDFLRGLPPGTTQQAYPVIGADGRVTGLLTADAIRAVPAGRWDALRVADLAFPLDRVTVVTEGEPLLAAVQKVDSGDVREGLVVSADGRVVGTIDSQAIEQVMRARQADLATHR